MDQPVSSAFRPVITHVEVPPGMLRPEHFDHAGGLAEVTERAPQAVVRAGAADLSEIRLEGRAVEPLDEADRVCAIWWSSRPRGTRPVISAFSTRRTR